MAATLATEPAGGGKQGLAVRLSDADNYLRATRTALERVQAGTVTTLAEYSRPVADGDRLTVRCQGSTITAFINGTQVATATESFNSGATRFGILVEE